MWTEFWDMYSGGSYKEDYHHIFIEAPEDEAKVIFYNRFGHRPGRITCACCGEDYSIDQYDTLDEATNYYRKSGETVEDYGEREEVLYIPASDIKDHERI